MAEEKVTYKSPAERRADRILQGVQIIQKHTPKASLIGLDKGVFVGPAKDPKDDLSYTTQEMDQLKSLGWTWNSEQESWEYYTGHG